MARRRAPTDFVPPPTNSSREERASRRGPTRVVAEQTLSAEEEEGLKPAKNNAFQKAKKSKNKFKEQKQEQVKAEAKESPAKMSSSKPAKGGRPPAAPPPPPPPPSAPNDPPPPPDDDLLRDFISFDDIEVTPEPEPAPKPRQQHRPEPSSSRRDSAKDSKRQRKRQKPDDSLRAQPMSSKHTHFDDQGNASKARKRKADEMITDSDAYPRKSHERLQARKETPWCSKVDWFAEKDVVKLLNKEILAAAEWISPTPEEQLVRDRAIQRVRESIMSRWSRAQVHVFGSHETQLYLPGGDIDVVVDNSNMIFRRVQEFFEPTIAALSRNGVIKPEREHPVERVYFAKVPIIKIVTAEGNIKIDISLNMTNGVQAGMIVKEYLAAMPAVRPLVMLLKSFTWRMDAHEPFNGGMGSYAITCLVISFLQQHPKIRHGEIDPLENLGILLIEFFELYGRNFNWATTGISIVHGGRYFIKAASTIGQMSMRLGVKNASRIAFCIEDPQNSANDIAKSTWDSGYILDIFCKAYTRLTQNVKERVAEFNWREAAAKAKGQKEGPMHPDWEDSEGRFDPNRMSLLTGVIGFDYASLDHRAGLHEIFLYRNLRLPVSAPNLPAKPAAHPHSKQQAPPKRSVIPPPVQAPVPPVASYSHLRAIMVDESDPHTAHRRDGGYFTSDQDDDGEDSDVMALDQDVSKAAASSKKKTRHPRRSRNATSSSRSVGNDADDPHVISSDDDVQIIEEPEAGPSKPRATAAINGGYKESQLAFDHEEEEEEERARMEYLEQRRDKRRPTENSAPVYRFDDRMTDRDRDILAPQHANPPANGSRSAKRVKSNDKRAYWDAKSGKSMPQNDLWEHDLYGSSSRNGTSARQASRGQVPDGGLPYDGNQNEDATFASSWRQKAEEAKQRTKAGKDDIANNSDFISFDDL